jgi:hypothetical protein
MADRSAAHRQSSAREDKSAVAAKRLAEAEGPRNVTELYCLMGVLTWSLLERNRLTVSRERPGQPGLINIGRAVLHAGFLAPVKKSSK